MSKKIMKTAALTVILGTVLSFGGCINFALRALGFIAVAVGSDFLFDNNGLIDIFADGAGAVAPG